MDIVRTGMLTTFGVLFALLFVVVVTFIFAWFAAFTLKLLILLAVWVTKKVKGEK